MITTKQLRQVADVWPGKTPAKASYENSGDAKILKFRDVRDDGTIDWVNDEEGWIDTRYVDTAPFVQLESDTILLTNAAHSLEHIGKKMGYVEWLPDSVTTCFFVGELTAIRANGDDVLNRWLYLYLQTNQARREIAKAAEGAHLVPRHLKRIPICFPKREIQEAHLAIFEAHDATLSVARAELEAARRTKTALMQTLFTRGVRGRHTQFQDTKIGRLPAEWEVVRLGEMLLKIESGSSPQCEGFPARPGKWGVLKISAVSWSYFDENENKELPANITPDIADQVKIGDLIVSRANTTGLAGAAQVVEKLTSNLLLCDKTWRLIPNEDFSTKWLSLALKTNASRRQIEGSATGTSDSMKNISKRDFLRLWMPLPSPKDRESAVQTIQTAEAAISTIEAKITVLSRLKQSLLQNLLTGRLRVGA